MNHPYTCLYCVQSFYLYNIAELLWYGKVLFLLLLYLSWGVVQCDICVSLLFVQYRYIPICNTKQYIYMTNYTPLHHSRTCCTCITINTLILEVHVYNKDIQIVSLQQVQLAQSVEHQTSDLRLVGSSPTMGKIFFILYCVAFDALLAGRLAQYKCNQEWRPSETYRCIERMIIWKKMAAALVPRTHFFKKSALSKQYTHTPFK